MGKIFSPPKPPKPPEPVIDYTETAETNVDGDARKTVKRRVESERKRRGRSALRIPMSNASGGVAT